jgi:hypothetical protein
MQAMLDVESKIVSAEEKGLTKGLAKSLLAILTVRYGALPQKIKQRIDRADCEQLEQWLDKAMTVKNLEELF